MVLDRICTAHLDARGASGLIGRHPAAQLVRRGCFDETSQFFIHLAFDCAFAKERSKAIHQVRKQAHRKIPQMSFQASMIRAIAETWRFQVVDSSESALRPRAVSA